MVAALALLTVCAGAGFGGRYLITNIKQIKPSVVKQIRGTRSGASGAPGAGGTQGPMGPMGPTGPQGPMGPSGDAHSVVATNVVTTNPNANTGDVVNCPAGSVVRGGGFSVSNVSYNAYADQPSGNGWYVAVANRGTQDTLTVYAICAS